MNIENIISLKDIVHTNIKLDIALSFNKNLQKKIVNIEKQIVIVKTSIDQGEKENNLEQKYQILCNTRQELYNVYQQSMLEYASLTFLQNCYDNNYEENVANPNHSDAVERYKLSWSSQFTDNLDLVADCIPQNVPEIENPTGIANIINQIDNADIFNMIINAEDDLADINAENDLVE